MLRKRENKNVLGVQMQFDDEDRVGNSKMCSLVEKMEAKNRVDLFRNLTQFVYGL